MVSMDTLIRNKHVGKPGPGGQFAEHTHSDPDEQLAPATDWGTVNIGEGSRSPWGTVDYASYPAPGVAFVGTPGHGGFKLSPERNRAVPAALRSSDGWYEEDAEWALAAYIHPEIVSHTDQTHDEIRDEADRIIRDWFPDKWEAHHGRELQEGESTTKDERLWKERNAHNFVTTSATTSEVDPELVRVTTVRMSDGAKAEFLVPGIEYRAHREAQRGGRARGFVVDPAKHPRVPDASQNRDARPTAIAPADRISASALAQAHIDGSVTAAAREKIEASLDKRWRMPDGSVVPTRTIISTQPAAITAHEQGGRMSYSVVVPKPDGSNFSLGITKAAFDYLSDVLPDDRSEATKAQQEYYLALNRIGRKPNPTAKEARLLDDLRTRYERLRDERTELARDAAATAAAERAARERAAAIDESLVAS